MKKFIPAMVAIVLIFVIVGAWAGTKVYEKYSYSDERADLEQYFEIDTDDGVAIVLQDEKIAEQAKIIDGIYYLDLASVHKYLNERFYWDGNESLLIYTTPTDMITSVVGSSAYTAEGAEQTENYVISVQEGEILYVALDYVKKYTNFSYEAFSTPNRMQMYTVWGEQTVAEIGKDTAVRFQGGVKSEILTNLVAGDKVVVLEEMENWSKVKTNDCYIGYVENKRLKNIAQEQQVPVTYYEEPVYTNIKKDYKISLMWHQIYRQEANANLDNVMAGVSGVNTISPTWFSLSDNQGNFNSFASSDYVAKAHAKGLEVWAMVDNFNYAHNYDADVSTQEVLSYTSKRQYLIDGLVNTALAYGIDGLNIDFEGIPAETGPHFIQFIRELSIKCREKGLVLSVDNYVPTSGTDYYEREEQGNVVDYFIIMGYDEHWRGCGTAGSVASIHFVDEGIAKTLEDVPAEKVINAVPFYTLVWRTDGGETTDETLTMANTGAYIDRNGLTPTWDEETCQNYVEFEEGNALYQVWFEDVESLQVKLNVMNKHALAGVAGWSLGLQSKDVWPLFEAYINS